MYWGSEASEPTGKGFWPNGCLCATEGQGSSGLYFWSWRISVLPSRQRGNHSASWTEKQRYPQLPPRLWYETKERELSYDKSSLTIGRQHLMLPLDATMASQTHGSLGYRTKHATLTTGAFPVPWTMYGKVTALGSWQPRAWGPFCDTGPWPHFPLKHFSRPGSKTDSMRAGFSFKSREVGVADAFPRWHHQGTHVKNNLKEILTSVK